MTNSSGSAQWKPPATRMGRWSVRLGVLLMGLFSLNIFVVTPLLQNTSASTYLSLFGFFLLALGLAAGIFGLASEVWQHERAWRVLLLGVAPGGLVVLAWLIERFTEN